MQCNVMSHDRTEINANQSQIGVISYVAACQSVWSLHDINSQESMLITSCNRSHSKNVLFGLGDGLRTKGTSVAMDTLKFSSLASQRQSRKYAVTDSSINIPRGLAARVWGVTQISSCWGFPLISKPWWTFRMIFIFFCLGRGKGSPRRRGVGGRFFIENPRRGLQEGEGPRGQEGVWANWGIWGGGA